TPEVAIRAAEGAGGQKRAVARNWTRFTVSVNSAGAGWVAGGDTLRVPRRHAWVPSARRSEAVDQAPRPSVSPSGSGLIAAERDGLHLSRNGSRARACAGRTSTRFQPSRPASCSPVSSPEPAAGELSRPRESPGRLRGAGRPHRAPSDR